MSGNGAAFNPKAYYRFFNKNYPNNTMSTGLQTVAPAGTPVNMTAAQNFCTCENWQIFYSSDRYFIRDIDTGGRLQLGLSADNTIVPRLLNRSGDLGQQWALTQWSDGSWRITNALLGNQSALGISIGNTVPGMDTSEGDGHWDISINVSAGQVTDADMLSDVQDVQNATSTSSTSASSSPTKSGVPTATTSTLSTSQHSAISSGAIAGIVIAVVVAIIVAACIAWFFRRRRRSSPSTNVQVPAPIGPPSELDGEPTREVRKEQIPRIELP